MGTWGYGIFENDTSLDIKDAFEKYIQEKNLTVTEATAIVLNEYEEYVKTFKETLPVIYLTLASLQIEYGELEDELRNKTLAVIESGMDLKCWEGDGEIAIKERSKVLEKFKLLLSKKK